MFLCPVALIRQTDDGQGVFMAEDKKKKTDGAADDAGYFVCDEDADDEEEEEPVDDKPDLDEALIGGEANAGQTLLDVYKGLGSLRGEYCRSYLSPAILFVARSIPVVVLAGFYAYGIKSAVKGEFDLTIAMILAIGTAIAAAMLYFLRGEKISLVWWKEKKRTVSVYKFEKGKDKGDIIVYVNRKYMWRFDHRQGQWKVNDVETMGSRLFFNELNGELKMKRSKNGTVEISTDNGGNSVSGRGGKKRVSVKMILKDGVPEYIEKTEQLRYPDRGALQKRLYIKETNSGAATALPRSFRDFCEENVIPPLEESEHLYYDR